MAYISLSQSRANLGLKDTTSSSSSGYIPLEQARTQLLTANKTKPTPISKPPVIGKPIQISKPITKPDTSLLGQAQNTIQNVVKGINFILNPKKLISPIPTKDIVKSTPQKPIKIEPNQKKLNQPQMQQVGLEPVNVKNVKVDTKKLQQQLKKQPDPIIKKATDAIIKAGVDTIVDVKNAFVETGKSWLDIPAGLQAFYKDKGKTYKPKDISPSAQRGIEFVMSFGKPGGFQPETGAVSGNIGFIKNQVVQKILGKLPKGEVEPQKVIGAVMKAGVEKTPEGKAIVKAAVQAEKQGKNIVIETKLPIESSVVQKINSKTGTKEFQTIPKGQLEDFKAKIDNSGGTVIKDEKGNTIHLTAKTPQQMEEKGFKNTGIAKIEDVPKPKAGDANAGLYDVTKAVPDAKIGKSILGEGKISVDMPKGGTLDYSVTKNGDVIIYNASNRTKTGEIIKGQGEVTKGIRYLIDQAKQNQKKIQIIGANDTGYWQHLGFDLKNTMNPIQDFSVAQQPTIGGVKPITKVTPKVEQPIAKTKAKITPEAKVVEKGQSSVFERLQKENPEQLQGELPYDKAILKTEFDKAATRIIKDKQKAYELAMGRQGVSDIESVATNIEMAEKALSEGNNQLYGKLIRNRSIAQTRRGQAIVAEKASIEDNSTARYVKELLSSRLDNLGKRYLSGLKEGSTISKRATEIIDGKVEALTVKIQRGKLDTKTALRLLDELACI